MEENEYEESPDLDSALEFELDNFIDEDDDEDNFEQFNNLLSPLGTSLTVLTSPEPDDDDLENFLQASNVLFAQLPPVQVNNFVSDSIIMEDNDTGLTFLGEVDSSPTSAKQNVTLSAQDTQIILDLVEQMIQSIEAVPIFISTPLETITPQPIEAIPQLLTIIDDNFTLNTSTFQPSSFDLSTSTSQANAYDERFHDIHSVEKERNDSNFAHLLSERNAAIESGDQILREQIASARLLREERAAKRLAVKKEAARGRMAVRLQCWFRCSLAKRHTNQLRTLKQIQLTQTLAQQREAAAAAQKIAQQIDQQKGYLAHTVCGQLLLLTIEWTYDSVLQCYIESEISKDWERERKQRELLAQQQVRENELKKEQNECILMAQNESEMRLFVQSERVYQMEQQRLHEEAEEEKQQAAQLLLLEQQEQQRELDQLQREAEELKQQQELIKQESSAATYNDSNHAKVQNLDPLNSDGHITTQSDDGEESSEDDECGYYSDENNNTNNDHSKTHSNATAGTQYTRKELRKHQHHQKVLRERNEVKWRDEEVRGSEMSITEILQSTQSTQDNTTRSSSSNSNSTNSTTNQHNPLNTNHLETQWSKLSEIHFNTNEAVFDKSVAAKCANMFYTPTLIDAAQPQSNTNISTIGDTNSTVNDILTSLRNWQTSTHSTHTQECAQMQSDNINTQTMLIEQSNDTNTEITAFYNKVLNFNQEIGSTTLTQFLREYSKNIAKHHKINVNCNDLSSLSGIELMTNCVELSANDNKIQSVTELSKLITLQELKLEINQISDITPLRALTQLKTLLLTRNKLHALPALETLTSLQKLILQYNHIHTIPTNCHIKLPPTLLILDLSFNKLTTVCGHVLSSACLLQTLILGNNALTAVPSPLFLPCLRELTLNSNQIDGLQAWSANSVTSSSSSSSSNSALFNNRSGGGGNSSYTQANSMLHTTPKSTTTNTNSANNTNETNSSTQYPLFLPMLTKLNLASNHITHIPPHIFTTLPLLKEVDLSFNHITTRSDLLHITDCFSLEKLRINDNDVSKIQTANQIVITNVVSELPLHHRLETKPILELNLWLYSKCQTLRMISDVTLDLQSYQSHIDLNNILDKTLCINDNINIMQQSAFDTYIHLLKAHQNNITAQNVRTRKLANQTHTVNATQTQDSELINNQISVELQYINFLLNTTQSQENHNKSQPVVLVWYTLRPPLQTITTQNTPKTSKFTAKQREARTLQIQCFYRCYKARRDATRRRKILGRIKYHDIDFDAIFSSDLDAQLESLLQSAEESETTSSSSSMSNMVYGDHIKKRRNRSAAGGGSSRDSSAETGISTSTDFYSDKPSSSATQYSSEVLNNNNNSHFTPRPLSVQTVHSEANEDTPYRESEPSFGQLNSHSNWQNHAGGVRGSYNSNSSSSSSAYLNPHPPSSTRQNVPIRAWDSPTAGGGRNMDGPDVLSQLAGHGLRTFGGGNVRTGFNDRMPPPNQNHHQHQSGQSSHGYNDHLTPRSQEEQSVNSDSRRPHLPRVGAGHKPKPMTSTVQSGSFGGAKKTVRLNVKKTASKRPAWYKGGEHEEDNNGEEG